MNKITAFALIILLSAIALLLLLSGLGIFPKYETVNVCPVNAITMEGQKAVIDSSKCIGCQRCVIGINIPVNRLRARETNDVAVLADSIAISTELTAKVAKPPVETAVSTPIPVKETKAVSPPKPSKPIVIPDKCISCQLCVTYCPVDAITMVNGKAVIDPVKCIDCGICIDGNNDDFAGCPVSAISKP